MPKPSSAILSRLQRLSLCALQIITMRGQFGFIKCCERPGELFFHNSALQDGPEGFAVGQDVEFSVTREPKGERPNAVEYVALPSTLHAPLLMPPSLAKNFLESSQVTCLKTKVQVSPRGSAHMLSSMLLVPLHFTLLC